MGISLEQLTNSVNKVMTKVKDKFILKEEGKGLSTNDYSTEDKSKVAKIDDIENSVKNVSSQIDEITYYAYPENAIELIDSLNDSNCHVINLKAYKKYTQQLTIINRDIDGLIINGNNATLDLGLKFTSTNIKNLTFKDIIFKTSQSFDFVSIFKNLENLTFDNCYFENTSLEYGGDCASMFLYMSDSNYVCNGITFNNCNFTFKSSFTNNINFKCATKIFNTDKNYSITNINYYNCKFYDLCAIPIEFRCVKDININSCNFENIPKTLKFANPVISNAPVKNCIINNCIFDNVYMGIEVVGINISIINCIFETFNAGENGGWVLSTTDTNGLFIENNKFINNRGSAMTISTSVSANRDNFHIKNNVFMDCSLNFSSDFNGTVYIENNTFINSSLDFIIYSPSFIINYLIFKNNVINLSSLSSSSGILRLSDSQNINNIVVDESNNIINPNGLIFSNLNKLTNIVLLVDGNKRRINNSQILKFQGKLTNSKGLIIKIPKTTAGGQQQSIIDLKFTMYNRNNTALFGEYRIVIGTFSEIKTPTVYKICGELGDIIATSTINDESVNISLIFLDADLITEDLDYLLDWIVMPGRSYRAELSIVSIPKN